MSGDPGGFESGFIRVNQDMHAYSEVVCLES
jgi:hypothetical protein